jgi:hypothetical protein
MAKPLDIQTIEYIQAIIRQWAKKWTEDDLVQRSLNIFAKSLNDKLDDLKEAAQG